MVHFSKASQAIRVATGLPCLFQAWSGRTADKATVEKNMAALQALLNAHGCHTQRVLIVGDSANLNSQLALAYAEHHLKYLAGVPLLEKAHRALVLAPTERELYRLPLTDERGPHGYWGWPCEVVFEHAGKRVAHQGLVVLSGPMRTALRRTRAQQFRALFAALHSVQAKIGHKRYRTPLEVQRRAETQLRRSPVGKLVHVEASLTPEGTVTLRWWIDRQALAHAMQADGRYLLATNDFTLSPRSMLARYRDKDAVEKRFRVLKQDVQIRPLFVHSDERVQAMLLINMIALLVYSVLERQAQQQGLTLTTRRILDYLSTLQVVELEAWDGSRTQTIANLTPEQQHLITLLMQGLDPLPLLNLPPAPPLLLLDAPGAPPTPASGKSPPPTSV